MSDRSERKIHAELEQSDGALRRLAEHMPAVLWSVDAELRFTSFLGAGSRTFGLSEHEVVGRTLSEVLGSEDSAPALIAAVRRGLSGSSAGCESDRGGRSLESRVEPLRGPDDTVVGCVGITYDVGERRAELERLERAAHTDLLTGLRNERAFHDDLARDLARRDRSDASLTLVVLDVDRLRETNDRLGRDGGDELLRSLAVCLTSTARVGDGVYRIGGDEFALVLAGERAWGALRLVQRLVAKLALSSRSGTTVVAGIAEATGLVPEEALLGQAHLALSEAKRLGRESLIYTAGLEPVEAVHEAEQHHLRTFAAALARAVDAKDSYTRSHCETVAETCALIGVELGLSPERVAKLRLAGLLHDVGKIGVADAILQKPGALTDEEFETMKGHSELGHRIVLGADLAQEAHWILHHHEQPDGGGYPDGLVGDEIPLESRIILVGDAFEAITSDRPHRRGRSQEEALEVLARHAGSQFDAECVAALASALAPVDAPALDEAFTSQS